MQVHPMIVHLPLGLWLTTPLVYTAAAWTKSAERAAQYATVGTVNLVLGSVAAIFALVTGLVAATSLPVVGLAQGTLTRHVAWALLTTLLFVAVTLLRAVGRPFSARPGAALLAAVWLSCAALLLTGYYGGHNVYFYGLGVDLEHANERALHRPPVVRELPPALP